MISARIVADSVNPQGSRLTSFILTYPRMIHSEFMTHRVFSRNSASSRAIPIEKMLLATNEDPAMPEFYGSKKAGMQAGEQLKTRDREQSMHAIMDLRIEAIKSVHAMSELGLHKQIANRYLEPWAHITVLATATDKGLANFFALRAHPMAMPEFQVLAFRMLALYMESKPNDLKWGHWHIPTFGESDLTGANIPIGDMIKIATARCARLSYLTHEGSHDPAKDIELHDRLLASRHLSPFEHCATAMSPFDPLVIAGLDYPYRYSNFDDGSEHCGWQQYRKMIEGENQIKIDLAATLAQKPDWITL